MAHELAVALQQAGLIWQSIAVKEPDVYVRGEDIDVAECRIAQTCGRAAVMEDFADFVAAVAHDLKPLAREAAQFAAMVVHPRFDGGIALDSAVEAQKVRFHGRSISAFDSILRGGVTQVGIAPTGLFGYRRIHAIALLARLPARKGVPLA